MAATAVPLSLANFLLDADGVNLFVPPAVTANCLAGPGRESSNDNCTTTVFRTSPTDRVGVLHLEILQMIGCHALQFPIVREMRIWESVAVRESGIAPLFMCEIQLDLQVMNPQHSKLRILPWVAKEGARIGIAPPRLVLHDNNVCRTNFEGGIEEGLRVLPLGKPGTVVVPLSFLLIIPCTFTPFISATMPTPSFPPAPSFPPLLQKQK